MKKMRKIMIMGCLMFMLAPVMPGCAQLQRGIHLNASAVYEDIEFEMQVIPEPVIPDYSVRITDFGAVEGGLELNSEAFAAAIEAVNQKGGGKIIIPAGIWLTGPVVLKSNIELHTEAGAV